jgi:radical SAM protein with 4Fe4S-binding SPASM domain
VARRGLLDKAADTARALLTREIRTEFENVPIRIEGASLRRIFNWLRVEAAIAAGSETPWGLPTYMHIEPTTHCNYACSFCPVGVPNDAPLGNMTLETFQSVLDDISETMLLISLWGWGEPFVNKAVYDMIAYAKSRDVKVISSTNGELFASEYHADAVVRSGLDALIVSIAGLSQEIQDTGRTGGKVENIFQGVRNIARQRELQGVKTPFISLSLIVTRHNEHELELLEPLGRELGADMVTVKKLNTSSFTHFDSSAKDRDAVPEDVTLQRFGYEEDDGARVRVEHNRCKAAWHDPSVRFDGRINTCAYDFHGVYDMGHLRDAPLSELWHGDAYRTFRRQFRSDWTKQPLCTQCTNAFEGGDYREIVASSVRVDDPEPR